jgi:rhodanese-related sulfurtransferase
MGPGHILLLAAAMGFGRIATSYGDPTAPAPTPITEAIIGESGQPTPEISTAEMVRVVAGRSGLIIDARPYEEFAVSHIPGAVTVAPKPGLAMSRFTSDVGGIDKLTRGNKGAMITLYCNGPFCGKSKRVAADLVAAGYTNVRRYQLGIPVWRALGHATQFEAESIWSTLEKDKTAVVIDSREPEALAKGTLTAILGARSVRSGEVAKAKDDGRLPMLDHNTRIFVIGQGEAEARAVAEEIARNAFHNVSFFAGSIETLQQSREASGSR